MRLFYQAPELMMLRYSHKAGMHVRHVSVEILLLHQAPSKHIEYMCTPHHAESAHCGTTESQSESV